TPMVVASPELPEPSLEVVKLAWLATRAVQFVAVVGLLMWTLKVLPGPGEAARSVVEPPQVRVLVVVPVIAHAELVGLTDQLSPALAGSTSVMVKPWATPPPLLVAKIV